MKVRAVVLGVDRKEGTVGYAPNNVPFYVQYKILKRGRKKKREVFLLARDELSAFMAMQERLRERGYKV